MMSLRPYVLLALAAFFFLTVVAMVALLGLGAVALVRRLRAGGTR